MLRCACCTVKPQPCYPHPLVAIHPSLFTHRCSPVFNPPPLFPITPPTYFLFPRLYSLLPRLLIPLPPPRFPITSKKKFPLLWLYYLLPRQKNPYSPASIIYSPVRTCVCCLRLPPHPHICQAVAMDDRDLNDMSILFERGERDLVGPVWNLTPMNLGEVLR